MNNDWTRDLFWKIIARLKDDAFFSVDAQLRSGAIESEQMAEQIKNEIWDDCETLADFIQFVCTKYHILMKESEYDKIN